MPTLPLFSAAGHPDAWHEVLAPGGYEWWYFDAEDEAADVQIVGIVLDGFVFHPGYLRRHFKYLSRPTKVAPVGARDFPCAYFVIYEKGKVAAQFMTQYPAGALRAGRDAVDVEMGPNSIRTRPDGGLSVRLEGTPWKLTARGPQTLTGKTLSVDWTITPATVHPPAERRFLSKAMTGADHHWVLAQPHARFEATVELTGGGGDRTWRLRGRGYHDHNYGTGPLGPGLKRWIWGRALFDDACYTFHYAVPTDGALPPEPHLVRVGAGGVEEVRVAAGGVEADWSRSVLGLKYPARLAFGETMKLSEPRMIDPSPFYLRLMYKAECEGRTGTAFCEVAYPHRLRWPVLGRMIEMSFDRR